MELAVATQTSGKSEAQQKYFYEKIEKKRSEIGKNKKAEKYASIGALCFLVLLAFFSSRPTLSYQSELMTISLLMFVVLYLTGAILSKKNQKFTLSGHEYIFYQLINIQKFLMVGETTDAKERAKKLIFYIDDLKSNYSNDTFTNNISNNLNKFEKILLENFYASLDHNDDEVAKNRDVYLKNVIYHAKDGDLDAICNVDISSLASVKKNLDELYEPTRLEKIYDAIKGSYSIPELRFLVIFTIVLSIILLSDFLILQERKWTLVKNDFLIVLLISATIAVGLLNIRKREKYS